MKRVALLALALALGCNDDSPPEVGFMFVLPREGSIDPSYLPIETPIRVELYRPAGTKVTAATTAGTSDCKATLEADESITLQATTPGNTTLTLTIGLPDGRAVTKTNTYSFASLASLAVKRSLQHSPAAEADVLLVGQAFEWCTNGYSDDGRIIGGLAIQTELSARLVLERPQFLTNSSADDFCALYRSTGPTAGVAVFRTSKLRKVVQVNVVDEQRVTKLELVSLITFGEDQLETSAPSVLGQLAVKTAFVLEGPSCIAPLGARFTIDDGRMGMLPSSRLSSEPPSLRDVRADEDTPYIPVREPGKVTARLGSFEVSANITAGPCY